MIVSVSRRTDVPAFHFDWFMNRIDAGYALVRNPVFPKKVHRVPLGVGDVDMLFFISKDPRPAIPHLQELRDMGYEMSFQVTVNPYGRDTEPNVPDDGTVCKAVREISEILGRDRVAWRYDPVLFNDRYDLDFHRESFGRIASELEGHVERCIFTFLDVYDKHAPLFAAGRLREVTDAERMDFIRTVVPIAEGYGMEMSTCCTETDYSKYGPNKRPCIDSRSMRAWGIPYEPQTTPVRKGCGCVRTVDIGAYDTCRHDCVYCYANRAGSAARSARAYDPRSEMLYGTLGPDDEIADIRGRKDARLSDFL